MKRLLIITASVFLISFSTFLRVAGQTTPTTNSSSNSITVSRPINTLSMRQMEQWRLISVGEKSGKITQKQAKDLRADLKSIHKKAANYLRASSNHQLTSDQESQLKALLDKNSQVLGETPTTN